VASLNRPGGNLTGVSFLTIEVAAKRLELIRELVPSATSIALLVDPTDRLSRAETTQVETAARILRRAPACRERKQRKLNRGGLCDCCSAKGGRASGRRKPPVCRRARSNSRSGCPRDTHDLCPARIRQGWGSCGATQIAVGHSSAETKHSGLGQANALTVPAARANATNRNFFIEISPIAIGVVNCSRGSNTNDVLGGGGLAVGPNHAQPAVPCHAWRRSGVCCWTLARKGAGWCGTPARLSHATAPRSFQRVEDGSPAAGERRP
jgi:hypothetical protein